ncbi:hypothetical protein [Rhodoflexus sp.]
MDTHEKYISFQYDEANRMLTSVWNTTAYMSDEEYRQVAMAYRHACERYKPLLSLIDSRNANYTIPVATQEWLNENIYPQCVAAGVHKLAFLVAQDFFTQISLELMVSDAEEAITPDLLQQRFFDDLDKARAWLLR